MKLTTSRLFKLRTCAETECDGGCCARGTGLYPEEVGILKKVIADNAEYFDFLPDEIFGEREHHGARCTIIKTAPFVRPNKISDFPETMCVFYRDGGCSLQTLAEMKGLHKWTYKPKVCWLFPAYGNDIVDHVEMSSEYPCCREHPDARVWTEALKEELDYHKSRR